MARPIPLFFLGVLLASGCGLHIRELSRRPSVAWVRVVEQRGGGVAVDLADVEAVGRTPLRVPLRSTVIEESVTDVDRIALGVAGSLLGLGGKNKARLDMYVSRIVQDSQDYGSNDEHMVSRVFFDLNVDGTKYPELSADIKRTVGGSCESSDLETSRPNGYSGPMNYERFRSIVEKLFRQMVGERAGAIRITGSSNVRMRNNVFKLGITYRFYAEDGSGSW